MASTSGTYTIEEIEEHLDALEARARTLDLEAAEREHLQSRVLAYCQRFLEALPSAKAYAVTDDKGIGLLDHPIRESGRSIDELLEIFAQEVERPGLNPASAGHLGYIPGGGVFPSAMADTIAAVTNRYAGVFFASPGAVRMENLLIRWMADLVGYPEGAGGDLSSGGSIANLTAIVTAREAKGVRARDIDSAVIYATPHVHHCVRKALVIAGLREAPVRRVRMDDRYRMDPADLTEKVREDESAGLRPFLVVGSAGTTDTGAVDPIEEIADVADAHDLWFHIDAAYGGFFALCPEAPPDLRHLHRADSVVLDPHKGLFLPYGSGALIVRDREALYRAHRYDANYMQDTLRSRDAPSPADHSPELTRHYRGLRLWLPLMLAGVAPFRACLSEKIWLTRYFHEKVAALPHMCVGPEPELSVSLFRYAPPGGDANALNDELVQGIHRDGRVFLSSTNIDGQVWLRLAVLAFRTTKETVDQALLVLRELTAAPG